MQATEAEETSWGVFGEGRVGFAGKLPFRDTPMPTRTSFNLLIELANVVFMFALYTLKSALPSRPIPSANYTWNYIGYFPFGKGTCASPSPHSAP